MGTEFTSKQIKRAVVVAAKASKMLGERDDREDRSFDGDNFGINLTVVEETPTVYAKLKEEIVKKLEDDWL